ncbi:hypothetical protein A2Z33_04450 [Candidatus Gottesmanbacteria bacterium RBG_16_52_11]|uniref:Uncharacterized protein n=1 Tax=Candidatus Gottesmanbacteria bacterium RBG_16_52_11 TaxID=1798374 RepID=A0A1F5YWD4_9BACT|nr:MAG: hypothetical protein A2Z33_04450 [Candidatus Gottesmanbacteria bacterium RBG_16_52_11]
MVRFVSYSINLIKSASIRNLDLSVRCTGYAHFTMPGIFFVPDNLQFTNGLQAIRNEIWSEKWQK